MPSTIMKTLNKPNIQFEKNTSPQIMHVPMHCSPCRDAKLGESPQYRKTHTYTPGEAISSDVAGPFNQHGQELEGAYFVACVDAASRYALFIPHTDRTKVIPFIEQSIAQFMTSFKKAARVFVSDNAQEYVSKEMNEILNDFNIQHHPTTPYSAQENGIAERINQTVLNAIRAALFTADLPPAYWHYAMYDVVDKYNML